MLSSFILQIIYIWIKKDLLQIEKESSRRNQHIAYQFSRMELKQPPQLFPHLYNNQILMNPATTISEGCIRQLYLHNRCQYKQPCVQLLQFQQSQGNEKQITMRISDGVHFLDCTLSGNYLISNDSIIQTKNATTVTTFRRYHFIKILDYFSKIDSNRISKLKVIVRKMGDPQICSYLIGLPQEIHQSIQNSKKNGTQTTVKKSKDEKSIDSSHTKSEPVFIKLENGMDIEPPGFCFTNPPTLLNSASQSKTQKKEVIPSTIQQLSIPNEPQNQGSQSLTLADILIGKEGFLLARLLRLKAAKKETKDGPMSVVYMGLADRQGDLIRLNLAGRIAMNNEKNLKKNKSYYIRGFDVVQVKNTGLQIRLKDKQYKIVEVYNEEITKQLPNEVYRWDHLHQTQQEYDFVDVIGVIEDIEQKATYNNNPVDSKSVVRVILKNKFKTIKISFWTDQIKIFESFNLKRKDKIIIQDIRKKQSKYYDFSFESTLIPLKQYPFLQEKFQDIIPEINSDIQPQNIKELQKFFEQDPNNSKVQNLKLYLVHCRDKKIIYYVCQQCKKKIQRGIKQCTECFSKNLNYKYNCQLEFSDSTGSVVTIAFDMVAQKLLGKTANQVSLLSEAEIQGLFEGLFYRYFLVSIENRNQRLILRGVEPLDQAQQANESRQILQRINENSHRNIW